MNRSPRSPWNKKPQNRCWCCGKGLVINALGKGYMRIYDDRIAHGKCVYGFVCYPYCDRVDDIELI